MKQIWEQFRNRAAEQGASVSKRATSSAHLEGDPDLLGRWTNPGVHKNWRIPVARIPTVCRDLGASSVQLDDLMWARLTELAEDTPDKLNNEVVAAMWGFDQGASPFNQDEQELLRVWRAIAAKYPRGLYLDAEEGPVLETFFKRLLARAERLHAEEAEAHRFQDPATAATIVRARESAAEQTDIRKLQQQTRRKQVSSARITKEFLGRLRRTRP